MFLDLQLPSATALGDDGTWTHGGIMVGGVDRRGTSMPYKSPWHSSKQNVHHNNSNCNTGKNIDQENIRYGTGYKPLCKECADLNRARK